MSSAAVYLAKARRALSSAQTLLRVDDFEGACNRAYYAMFDAAHAALWASGARHDGDVIKTHAGLVAAFGELMVKPGLFSAEHGRALSTVLKTRLLADYTGEIPDPEHVRRTIALAELFVADVSAFETARR